MPDATLDRPKKGFGVPLGRWFRGALRPMVRELLLADTSRPRGFFNATRVEQLLDRHDRGHPLDQQLWMLMSFELWCRTFLDRQGRVEVQSPPPLAFVSSLRPAGRRLSGDKGAVFRAALAQRGAS